MKKNIFNLLKPLIIFISLILMINNSSKVINAVLLSISIWKNNVFTTLFPFFIVSDLLIQYGFIDILSEVTKNITMRLFNLPGESSFVIISSLFTGFPSSSKYTKELLDKKIITIKDAEYLLSFTHFPNPIFVTGVIGNLLNRKASLLILVSIYLGNLFNALMFKNKKTTKKEKIDFIKTIKKIETNTRDKSFINILSNSIVKAVDVLVLVLGVITFFFIISSFINEILSFNYTTNSIISGLLEMTQGIKKVANINISIHIKATIITSLISFGGISIHMQTMSILDTYNISYIKYLFKRIIHSIISGFLAYILYNLYLT